MAPSCSLAFVASPDTTPATPSNQFRTPYTAATHVLAQWRSHRPYLCTSATALFFFTSLSPWLPCILQSSIPGPSPALSLLPCPTFPHIVRHRSSPYDDKVCWQAVPPSCNCHCIHPGNSQATPKIFTSTTLTAAWATHVYASLPLCWTQPPCISLH